jgi:hypothetical protein
MSLFDENIKFDFTVEKIVHFRPGFGSGSKYSIMNVVPKHCSKDIFCG